MSKVSLVYRTITGALSAEKLLLCPSVTWYIQDMSTDSRIFH